MLPKNVIVNTPVNLKRIVQIKLYKNDISVIPQTKASVSSGKPGKRYIKGREALPPIVSRCFDFSISFSSISKLINFLPPNLPIKNIKEEVKTTLIDKTMNVLIIPSIVLSLNIRFPKEMKNIEEIPGNRLTIGEMIKNKK